jgi:hypothetical protein
MVRGLLTGLALAIAATAPAADPPRYRWQPGQELTYSSEQITTVVETTVEDGSPATALIATRVAMTRHWTVRSVEPDGTATLELTITAMKRMIARPGPRDRDGNPTIDRTIVDSATEDGRRQMAGFLGKPVVVKVDGRGQVRKVTTGSGDAPGEDVLIPVVFPESRPAGGTWDWSYPISSPLPSSDGGGNFEARRRYSIRGEIDGTMTIDLSTELKSPPNDPADRVALLPQLWQGEVTFHRATGRYTGATLAVKREVASHKGEGSRFVYESRFTERLVEKQ